MFDIGWSEMAVIVLVALVVIGPKELPNALRTAAKWARKARGLAREFQSGVDDLIREADLDDARKAIEAAKSTDVGKLVSDTVDPTGSVGDEVRSIDGAVRSDAALTADTGEPPAVDDGPGPNIAPPHSLTPPAEKSETPAKPEPAAKPAPATAPATEEAGKTA